MLPGRLHGQFLREYYAVTMFGSGNGLLTFHVDDAAEIIRIFNITWIG